MDVAVLAEPELEFCDGAHVDVRAGLRGFGVLDRGAAGVPRPIRVGVVGTVETVRGVRDYLEQCRDGVASKEQRLRDLRPDFPGVTDQVFGTTLETRDSCTRTIPIRDLARKGGGDGIAEDVTTFFEHARDLASSGSTDVMLIAPPVVTFANEARPQLEQTEGLDETQDEDPLEYRRSFHDLFKARALDLGVPCQVIRPDTYGGGSTRKSRGKNAQSLQEPATRAWNIHTALYYKAGGVPWRLRRDPTSFATCYVGISFFRSVDGDRLLTSVAQVFNERGEGVIVQGGNARLEKNDRIPHLSEADASRLTLGALKAYRREHGNTPARLIMHKTSPFDALELEGCQAAAQEERIAYVDLVNVRRGGVRLFRHGIYPPLRGTFLAFDDRAGMVYLRGSVPQFRTYPGMYVPRAFEFERAAGESSPKDLAAECLALSKLNFNNTQFDGGEPVTVRAARKVGDILKNVAPGRDIETRFRYFT